jgi:hypothetical protein
MKLCSMARRTVEIYSYDLITFSPQNMCMYLAGAVCWLIDANILGKSSAHPFPIFG